MLSYSRDTCVFVGGGGFKGGHGRCEGREGYGGRVVLEVGKVLSDYRLNLD